MKIEDYKAKFALFYETNPFLASKELAVVLTADLLYKDIPEDIDQFRKKYAHFDPTIITRPNDGITFIKISRERRAKETIKSQLNNYLNVKFHHIKHKKGYKANALIFKEKSIIASQVIEEILRKTDFPPEIIEVLREREEVKSCYDFYDMLKLFNRTRDERLRFEIIRKIGLIVLIARINRTVGIEELESRKKEVWKAIDKGLRYSPKSEKRYYLWLNEKKKVAFYTNLKYAEKCYRNDVEIRRRQACEIYPMQKFVAHPFKTISGNEILHMEIRSKFGVKGNLSYASYVEKMLRKNLEFPNQVRDIIGLKIVMEKESQIQSIIRDLEAFLGGSSTRKMEKNSYHRFGRRRLSEYSSPEYSVWKAVYDITLPHPAISHIKKMMKITRQNRLAQDELKGRLNYLINNPRDFVLEVQLQDIKSYLLSIAKGSPTAHAWLKTNQIRSNSFYKIFPKEIYQNDIKHLKLHFLNKGSSSKQT